MNVTRDGEPTPSSSRTRTVSSLLVGSTIRPEHQRPERLVVDRGEPERVIQPAQGVPEDQRAGGRHDRRPEMPGAKESRSPEHVGQRAGAVSPSPAAAPAGPRRGPIRCGRSRINKELAVTVVLQLGVGHLRPIAHRRPVPEPGDQHIHLCRGNRLPAHPRRALVARGGIRHVRHRVPGLDHCIQRRVDKRPPHREPPQLRRVRQEHPPG